MSGYGILDYEGMNQAIYRGATSNIVVDTQKMGIGIGVDQNGPSSNLHVVGNTRLEGDINMIHTSNTSSMKVNSNVVTEFPRSKKLIKYPRVALTGSTSGGYTASASDEEPNYNAWKAFENLNTNTDAWSTDFSENRYDVNTGEATTNTPLFEGERGDWIQLQLPTKIKLEYIVIDSRHVAHNKTPEASPGDGRIFGSTDGTNWTLITSFSGRKYGGDASNENATAETILTSTNAYYNYYRLQVTKRAGQHGTDKYVAIGQLEYFGLPEYDPNATGMDVKVTSYPNVPNTDWLEVYYDAKEPSSYPGTGGTVLDLSGNQINGTLSTSGGFEDINGVKAFTSSGSTPHALTATTTLNGSPAMSFSMWVKFDTFSSGNSIIYLLGNANVNNQMVWVAASSNGSKWLLANGGSGAYYEYGNESLTLHSWIHVTTVYSGGTYPDGLSLYVNGKLLNYSSFNGLGSSLTLPTNSPLVIGWYSSGDEFDGSIANFRLFNRAITQDEVWQLYAYQKEYFGHGDLSMTLKAGRLGIGTSEPRAALDVRGDVHISGTLRKTRAQMIRLESGGKRFTASGWQAYVAYGEEWTAYSSNPLYSVSITGDYVDGNHKSINYRIAVQNQRTREVVYFPDTTGWRKYLYIYDNRLDGHGYFGIMSGLIPGDLYKVQLEVEPRSNGTSDDYEWNSIYGTITGLVWD